MKLEYKGKKWDKEVENYQKTLKKLKQLITMNYIQLISF